jgi:hypothetical protein
MSVELHASRERARPNVSGDLGEVFQAAPMFRRALSGYDRFQVDSYVRWAEEELTAAEREHEHLLARHLRTRAALDEARELMAHSTDGGEFLRQSRRMAALLAAAADEAEGMRVEAQADRAAAAAESAELVAAAEKTLEDAEAEADSLLAEAALRIEEITATAALLVEEAEQAGREARTEAEARLAKVREIERQADEAAARIRQQATDDAAAARLQARAEVLRLLDAGRQERRRADEAADAARQRQDDAAATRAAAVRAEITRLQRRRTALAREVASLEQRSAALGADADLLAVRSIEGSPLQRVRGRLPHPWRLRTH